MEPKTDVIFRKEKDGQILAVFPHEVDNSHFVMCYAHLGQHSSCDYDYCLTRTTPAIAEEFEDLKNELTLSVGYNLNIIKRRNYNKYLKSYYKNQNEDLKNLINKWLSKL